MNKVILTGNICKDISLAQTQAGTKVVSNTIAVKRDFKNAQGEYESDFIPFVAWNSQADFLDKYANKGDKIELCGRWQVRTYQDQQGMNRQVNEVVAENLSILINKAKEETVDSLQPIEVKADDLPF